MQYIAGYPTLGAKIIYAPIKKTAELRREKSTQMREKEQKQNICYGIRLYSRYFC